MPPSPYIVSAYNAPSATGGGTAGYFTSKRGDLVYDWAGNTGVRGHQPDAFSSLPTGFAARPIVLPQSGSTTEAFFFAGNQVVLYDWSRQAVVGKVTDITNKFSYLPFVEGIDAVLPAVGGDDYVCFFRGGQCAVYDVTGDSQVSGPQAISAYWQGADPAFDTSGVSAALHHPGEDRAFLFVDNRFQEFTPSTGKAVGALRKVSDGPWNGITLLSHGTVYVGTNKTLAVVDVDSGVVVRHDDVTCDAKMLVAANPGFDHLVFGDSDLVSNPSSVDNPCVSGQPWCGNVLAVSYPADDRVYAIDSDAQLNGPVGILQFYPDKDGALLRENTVHVDPGDLSVEGAGLSGNAACFVVEDEEGKVYVDGVDASAGGTLSASTPLKGRTINGPIGFIPYDNGGDCGCVIAGDGYIAYVDSDGGRSEEVGSLKQCFGGCFSENSRLVYGLTYDSTTIVFDLLDPTGSMRTIKRLGYHVAVNPQETAIYLVQDGRIIAVDPESGDILGDPIAVPGAGQDGFILMRPWGGGQ
ncbi:hypothetical protein [Kitasatospora sp. NPDC094016]|uniref:hypothetical protein n=1 Tax=Kitasatospora sp. NPDC094016 TaxID=3154986 RepID=UPI003325A469